jgi:hypothetical protein
MAKFTCILLYSLSADGTLAGRWCIFDDIKNLLNLEKESFSLNWHELISDIKG